jgi:hypothetical protein
VVNHTPAGGLRISFYEKSDSFVKIENGMGKFKKEHNAMKQARE